MSVCEHEFFMKHSCEHCTYRKGVFCQNHQSVLFNKYKFNIIWRDLLSELSDRSSVSVSEGEVPAR